MIDKRSLVEKKYGREVAHRWSRCCRAFLLVYLLFLVIASGVLFLQVGRAMLPIFVLCQVLGCIGVAALWRMRRTEIAWYEHREATAPDERDSDLSASQS
jgi:hypothetical protein